jgi:hypothetical protein
MEKDIPSPQAAGAAEHKWMEYYKTNGWTLLNKAKAGGTGAVLKQKWSKEAVMAEARKYATKQEWIDNSQFTYRLAKKMGWFDEASAHMPKRVLGIGLGLKRSAAVRWKLNDRVRPERWLSASVLSCLTKPRRAFPPGFFITRQCKSPHGTA